jgi:hypothetical protein
MRLTLYYLPNACSLALYALPKETRQPYALQQEGL